MTYKLFLDDERFPVKDDWFIARTHEEAVSIVQIWGLPQMISFDHDLGQEKTGMDFAHWITDYILDHRDEFDPARFSYYVHSQNPVGAAHIRALLDGFLSFLKGDDDVRILGSVEEGSDDRSQGETIP